MRVLNALLLMPLLGLVLPRSGLLGCTKLMMPRPRSSSISNPSLFQKIRSKMCRLPRRIRSKIFLRRSMHSSFSGAGNVSSDVFVRMNVER